MPSDAAPHSVASSCSTVGVRARRRRARAAGGGDAALAAAGGGTLAGGGTGMTYRLENAIDAGRCSETSTVPDSRVPGVTPKSGPVPEVHA